MPSSSTGRAATRILPIFVLFVLSGCAALVYEIVWFQMLQLVLGASAVSLTVLLGTFMGGMFAGSLLLARYGPAATHPFRVFAALEMAIALWATLLVGVMPLVGRIYTATDDGDTSSVLLRALACLVLLFPPAMFMGATLPAIARHLTATPKGAARLGLLYAGNILGAVLGCLLAGFYLLRTVDLASASLVAVSLNALAATGAWLLARRTAHAPATLANRTPAAISSSAGDDISPGYSRAVYAVIAVSGFTALASEVVWTRLLSLLFGATTYTFSMILAVFLTGLGAGNAIGAALVTRVNARAMLGWVQLGLAFAIAYGAWMVTRTLPYWPIDTSLAPAAALDAWTDLSRALLMMLPGAILWGVSFPFAVAAAARTAHDTGAIVGRMYAANTLGAVAGAVLTPLLLIPRAGTTATQQLLVVVSALAACVILLPVAINARPKGSGIRVTGTIGVLILLLAGAAMAAATVSPVPAGLVAWGRLFPWYGEPVALYVGEGVNASVAVTRDAGGWRNFHVSGKVEASTEPQDMRLQRLLGHLTTLMHERGPRSALVVGFGAGVTAGAVSIHPSVEQLVVCELEPLIPRVVSRYFGDVNYDVATNLKVKVVHDDARHYMVTARETFDVITSDPVHPWVKGAATLYTKEYFEHVRSRLNPGGVATQWVPLYESTEDSVRSVIATFLEVFPNGTVWRNDDANGAGYDAVLVGRLDETPIDVHAWQARLERPEFEKVRHSLSDVGYRDVVDLLATYLGRGRDLRPWLAGAAINRDRNLHLQYLAGDAVNNNTGTPIRDAILRYRRFPEDLFTGERDTLTMLREGMEEER